MILRELFVNTDQWARTDAENRRLLPSVRLVHSRWVAEGLETMLRRAAGDPGLHRYLSHDVHAGDPRPLARS
jgi:hypothetical protein